MVDRSGPSGATGTGRLVPRTRSPTRPAMCPSGESSTPREKCSRSVYIAGPIPHNATVDDEMPSSGGGRSGPRDRAVCSTGDSGGAQRPGRKARPLSLPQFCPWSGRVGSRRDHPNGSSGPCPRPRCQTAPPREGPVHERLGPGRPRRVRRSPGPAGRRWPRPGSSRCRGCCGWPPGRRSRTVTVGAVEEHIGHLVGRRTPGRDSTPGRWPPLTRTQVGTQPVDPAGQLDHRLHVLLAGRARPRPGGPPRRGSGWRPGPGARGGRGRRRCPRRRGEPAGRGHHDRIDDQPGRSPAAARSADQPRRWPVVASRPVLTARTAKSSRTVAIWASTSVGGQVVDRGDLGGVLGGDGGDHGGGEDAERAHGLEVGLDAGPGTGVGPGDGQGHRRRRHAAGPRSPVDHARRRASRPRRGNAG